MEPITRKEKFYAAAAGDAVALPEPVSREEKWLHRMATRFGDTPTGGDTLTWDGNTEGLLEVVGQAGCEFEGMKFYKVSNVVLTEDEIYNFQYIYENGELVIDHEDPALAHDEMEAMFAEIGLGMLYQMVLCAQTDNYTFQGFAGTAITVPEKGIYFAPNTTAFKVLGCTKFPSVKPVEGKYLFGGESEEYPGCLYRKVGTEKEWLNPPMVDGEVYRTMERHDGLPVYTAKVHAELPADIDSGGVMEVPFDLGGGVPFSVSGNIFMGGAYFALPLEGADEMRRDTLYCRAFAVGDGADRIIIPYGASADLVNAVVTVTVKWVKPEQGMQTFNLRRPQPSKWVSENAIVIDRYVKQPKTWEEIKQERMGEAGDL